MLMTPAAAEIAEEYLADWRRVARYSELALMAENDDKDWDNVIGRDGEEYKVLLYVLPDTGGGLRMIVAVNHRRRGSSAPATTRESVMRPDGTFTK